MKAATKHNEPDSVPISHRGRPHEADLSEAEYLAREVADAKAALSHALADVKTGLAQSADVRLWVKHYPWAALGAAAAAGFAAAAAVTPAAGQSLQDKFSQLRPSDQSAANETCTNLPPRAAKSSSVTNKLIDSLFELAKVLVQTIVLTLVRNSTPGTKIDRDADTPDHTTTTVAI
jgi:hypothetical protein